MISTKYEGKSVLVTGHTGFKGCWLACWLKELGADVHGVALDPERGSLFEVADLALSGDHRIDISDSRSVRDLILEIRPDYVFHLAAQPLVLRSYEAPLETMMTNVMGVANVLEAVRELDQVCHVVVVTSDKCYRNREWDYAYREVDELGGHDVYSASKAAAEIVTAAWEKSFFDDSNGSRVASARGGNVIGGGDFSANRIVPDSVKALAKNEVIEVRSPEATRPWQHVLDCLSGYLLVGEWLASDAAIEHREVRSFNFGPSQESQRTVRELVEELLVHWPGDWVDKSSVNAPHEAGRLSVAIERAAVVLGWKPVWEFDETVKCTVEFYRDHYKQSDSGELKKLMKSQIDMYSKKAAQVWK